MIQLTHLQKVVDGRTVIDIPELKVAAGEIVALVGPAGSGKRALLELLTGKARPSLGKVQIGGMEPHADAQRFSRQVGVQFEEDGLYERQTALENLTFHCRLHGLPTSRAENVLASIGLGDHAKMRADRLASGMKRRLAFGRAILHSPAVLLLAEPFARCDPASSALLSDLIRQQALTGSTVLILASDSANLMGLCTTVYSLEQGRITESYQPQTEQARAQTPFKIPVRMEGRVALVNPADILYAEAEEGRALLQTQDARLPTQFTITELEERLGRSGFFRAHRAYLVNLQHVKEVIPYTRDSFSLRLDDPANTEIPLSKSAANELKDLLGY